MVRCTAMLPAVRSTLSTDRSMHPEAALDAALERLVPGEPRAIADRSDTPDLRVTAVRRLPEVAAQYAPFPDTLDTRLVDALQSRGVRELYSHQAEAIDHARAGRHVVVITPTAS